MDKNEHEILAKLLAVLQFTMRGTPFMFQGDEMGLSNYEFSSIDEINDVESRNLYEQLIKEKSTEEAFEIIKAGSREHGRILLPWNNNSKNPLVHQQKINQSVLEAYKTLIKMRKENSVLVYGDFCLLRDEKNLFTYKREYTNENNDEVFIIDCNLGNKSKNSYKIPRNFNLIYTSNPDNINFAKLSPFEARIYRKN